MQRRRLKRRAFWAAVLLGLLLLALIGMVVQATNGLAGAVDRMARRPLGSS
jgi:hypothetical protein